MFNRGSVEQVVGIHVMMMELCGTASLQVSWESMTVCLTLASALENGMNPGRTDGACSDGSEQGDLQCPRRKGVSIDIFVSKRSLHSGQEVMVSLEMTINGTWLVSR